MRQAAENVKYKVTYAGFELPDSFRSACACCFGTNLHVSCACIPLPALAWCLHTSACTFQRHDAAVDRSWGEHAAFFA